MNELVLLKKKLEREQKARKEAERILEAKALELYKANEALLKLNESLEEQISKRTIELKESEAKFRNVIDQATDIIYSTDEEGYFTFINPIGSNAFGYSKDEIIGKQYINFVPDDYKKELFKYYTKIRDRGASNDYYEFPIQSKSGKIFWIGQNVNRIEKANGGFYYNAVARDITLRKTAEKELEKARIAIVQSEVKYRSVLENLELGLMEVNTEGEIIRVYQKFCEMTGYTSEELIGRNALDTFIVPEFENVLKHQDSRRLNKESGVYEVQIKRKDGKHIWVIISGAPFYNENGEVIGSLGIHFEITERKELERNLKIANEKALKAQKAEQAFLANMSHEIRTPLNAIIGMSHLIEDTILDKKQEEYLEILQDSADLLKGLVSDILDISKIDSGKAEMNKSVFDINSLAKKLVKTFAQQAKEKNIILKPTIDCDDQCIVKSDFQWLNQILINLLSNAIKFTPEGEVELVIKLTKKSDYSCQIYFEVRDTGIGISAEEKTKIFSSFKQANTNIRKEFGGTGLGLSIASRLVSLLGGELEVISSENNGSRFYFSLNMESSNETIATNTKIRDLEIKGSDNIYILIVEDNLMNQKYISSLLNKWNINYEIAENGQQAIDIYKMYTFDMIFMDLSMPVMDGYKATDIIRKLPGIEIPIIALTASTFLSKRELALNAGMNDFLAKPFTPIELYKMIQKHLNKVSSISKIEGEITLDKNLLSKLYGNDFGYALEMFELYLEVIDSEIDHLKNNSSNKEATKKQAHKMKPMFEMVGLSRLSALCLKVEKEIDIDNIDQMNNISRKIIDLSEKTKSLVINEIKSLSKNLKQES